jgi:hypothetical protein
MRIFIGLVLFIAIFADLTFVLISDDKKVYTQLDKKQLYRLAIIKDILNTIIIVSLVSLAFV